MKKAFYTTTALVVLAFFVLQGCDRDGTLDALGDETPRPENLMIAAHVSTPPAIDGVAGHRLGSGGVDPHLNQRSRHSCICGLRWTPLPGRNEGRLRRRLCLLPGALQ